MNECRAAAGLAKEANSAGAKSVEAALEKAMALHQHLKSHPETAKSLLDQNAIRVTKATANNEFTPTVKLVFGIEERSTISRYAKVLRYVAENTEDGDEFATVVERGGGLVQCARADTAHHKGAARERGAERREARLDMLRAHAVPLKSAPVTKRIHSRFATLLVEVTEDGAASIIGIRDEDDDISASRFYPIED